MILAGCGTTAETSTRTLSFVMEPFRNPGSDIAELVALPCSTGGMHVLAYDFPCMFEIWPAVERWFPHERTEGLRPPVIVAIGPALLREPFVIPGEVAMCSDGVPVLFYLGAPFDWIVVDKFLKPWFTLPRELRGFEIYAQGFAARDADWTFPLTGLPLVRFVMECR